MRVGAGVATRPDGAMERKWGMARWSSPLRRRCIHYPTLARHECLPSTLPGDVGCVNNNVIHSPSPRRFIAEEGVKDMLRAGREEKVRLAGSCRRRRRVPLGWHGWWRLYA